MEVRASKKDAVAAAAAQGVLRLWGPCLRPL